MERHSNISLNYNAFLFSEGAQTYEAFLFSLHSLDGLIFQLFFPLFGGNEATYELSLLFNVVSIDTVEWLMESNLSRFIL